MIRKLRIGQRMALGFGLLMILLLAVIATSYSGLAAYGDLLEGDIRVSQHAERARANLIGMRRFEKDMFLNVGDRAKEKRLRGEVEGAARTPARPARRSRSRLLDAPTTGRSSPQMRTLLGHYERGFACVASRMRDGELQTPQACNAEIAPSRTTLTAWRRSPRSSPSCTSRPPRRRRRRSVTRRRARAARC